MDINDYRVFVKNVTLSDAEWDTLMKQVVSDVAQETRIFKKLVGFTLEPTLEYYDFEAISGLHDKLDVEITNITIGSFDFEDIMKIAKDGCVPSLDTIEDEEFILDENMILDVNDIIDTSAKSIFKKFTFMQGYTYATCALPCETTANADCDQPQDEAFYVNNDKKAIAIISFEPDPDKITADIERRIKPAIIAGLKFFANDIYNDKDDAAVANLFYQRYFAAKRELINKYPYYNSNNRVDSSKKFV